MLFLQSMASGYCIGRDSRSGLGRVRGQGHARQPIAELRVDVRVRESHEINNLIVTPPTDRSDVIDAPARTYVSSFGFGFLDACSFRFRFCVRVYRRRYSEAIRPHC